MYGQLGHGDSEKQSAAKMVRALEGKVVYLLACGNFHTVRGTRTVLLCSLYMHGWWNNPGYNLIRRMAMIACILNNDCNPEVCIGPGLPYSECSNHCLSSLIEYISIKLHVFFFARLQ